MKIAVLNIDLGKNVCSVVGLDASGAVVLRRRVRRDTLIDLVAKPPACIVGMEACCGAHYLGRLFATQGHNIRLMSPEYVCGPMSRHRRATIVTRRSGDASDDAFRRGEDRSPTRYADAAPIQRTAGGWTNCSDRSVARSLAGTRHRRSKGKRKFEQYLVAMMDEHDGEG